jgi:hypothetical protein
MMMGEGKKVHSNNFFESGDEGQCSSIYNHGDENKNIYENTSRLCKEMKIQKIKYFLSLKKVFSKHNIFCHIFYLSVIYFHNSEESII